MRNVIKKIWNGINWVLILLLLAMAVLLAGVRLVGLYPLTVLSGSMEPEFSAGDLIYVKSVDYRDLKEGDFITFMLSEDTIATHRIVGVVPDEEDPSVIRYRTKGDANDAEDETLVHCMNVVGTPVYSLPQMGYVANYVQNPPGSYIAMSGAAVLMLMVFLPDLLFRDEPKRPRSRSSKKNKKARGGKYLRK